MQTRIVLSLPLLLAVLALTACNEQSFKGAIVKPIAVANGVASGPASPLFEFDLDGGESYDPNALEPNGIYEYEWSVLSTPPNATVTIDDDGENSEFTTDTPGRHVVQLRVRDINDFAWSDPTSFVLRAFPVTGFAVTLTWTTDVNDVDLHLLEETQGGDLFDQENDCHFANLRPDWPPMGSVDGDPSLNHDYVDGHGPETLELPAPTIGERYHVVIHYFSDDGFADTDATVKIWVNGTEEAELERNLVANQLWDVGVLDWTGATGQFGMVDSVSTY